RFLARRAQRRAPRRKERGCRPWLEPLEDRLAPAAVTWVGGSADWNTVSNWSDGTVNRLAGPTADAVINTSGMTGTPPAGSHTVHSLTSKAAINLTGGTLTVNGAFQETGATLALLGGTLANAVLTSDTTVQGSSSGGALSGVKVNADLSVVTPGGSLALSG